MKRHKVLVIGVGSIGERHVRCFQDTGRADASLLEIDEGLARTVAVRYGVSVHADLDSALATGVEAAVVATPAPLHVPLATRLVEAGLHVLIEKPLGTTLDGIERLRQAVVERGVVAAVAYVYRLHPALAAMRQAICEGRFGRPVELVAVAGQHFPTYRPAYRTIYYADRASGGGAIQDALTHLVNAGEWLLGPMDRLVVDARHQLLEDVDVEDTVHVLARHGPALASYALNQYQAPNEATITVVCQRGTARFESHRQRWRWMMEPGESWSDEHHDAVARDTMFIAQAHAFLDAVEGRIPPPCTLDEGLQTLRVNLAALASLQDQQWKAVRGE
ncbi:MAG TPA: Gfo/Idh/MocA family oxidoreductase [Pirellulales bacterium]|nr:Gfo/Idh/MocA family oxidoreductase [Pirellulales bacterium]